MLCIVNELLPPAVKTLPFHERQESRKTCKTKEPSLLQTFLKRRRCHKVNNTFNACTVNYFSGSHLSLSLPPFSRCILSSLLSSLSFLAGGTLRFTLSLISFLSFCTSWSLGSSLSLAALISFGSVTSITARCPRGTRHTGDAICPWLSTVTQWKRL